MVTDPDAVDRLLEEPRVEVEGGAAMVATGFEQARIRAGSRIVFHAHRPR
jgi:hypothetical protein